MSTTSTYKEFLEESPQMVDEGKGKRRNRIALAMFLSLAIIGGVVIFSYFATGRTWSVAATMVDDTVGNMSAYSVIVFNGVGDAKKFNGLEKSDVEYTTKGGFTTLNKYLDNPGQTNSASDNTSNSSDLSQGIIPLDENGEISLNSLSDKILSVFYRAMAKFRTEGQDRVFASDVRNLYETAGASACTINIAAPNFYDEPRIYKLKNKRIGVFGIDEYTSRAKLSKIIGELKSEDVNTIVCITPRPALISTYEGIDVVVVTSQYSLEPTQDDKGDCLIIPAPPRGEVGIILISPNNVPIFKSISEL